MTRFRAVLLITLMFGAAFANPAQARIFFGVGVPLYFAPPPVYYPPYYPPPYYAPRPYPAPGAEFFLRPPAKPPSKPRHAARLFRR